MADNNSNVTIHITGANPQIYPTAATVNNFYGDKFAEDKLKSERKVVAPTLMKYIYDDEKRAKVAAALQACTDPKSLSITIEQLCNEHIFKLSQVLESSFRESIIPLISFEANEQSIRKIIERANIM